MKPRRNKRGIVSALLTTAAITGFAISEPAWSAVQSMTGAKFESCNKRLCYRLDAAQIGKSYFTSYFLGRDLKLQIVDRKDFRIVKEWTSPHGMFDPKINRWILSEATATVSAPALVSVSVLATVGKIGTGAKTSADAATETATDLYFYPATFTYSYFRMQH